jgi:hypothetical protein
VSRAKDGGCVSRKRLRVSELLRLRIKDVDFERNQVVVRGGKGDSRGVYARCAGPKISEGGDGMGLAMDVAEPEVE